jgi:hypothetical protein
MNLDQIIKEIDVESARLQAARSILLSDETRRSGKAVESQGRRKRKMSAETKERIRKAQIKRWAKAKKAAAR